MDIQIVFPRAPGIASFETCSSDQPKLRMRFRHPSGTIFISVDAAADICRGDGTANDLERAKTYIKPLLIEILKQL